MNKKSEQNIEKKIPLPKIYGLALIQNICKKNFKGNLELCALLGSQTFFSEIFKLFSSLSSYEISAKTLFLILDKTEINPQDKKRLELIFIAYKEMCEKIENSNYFISQNMPDKTHQKELSNLNLWAREMAENFQKRSYLEFNDIQSEAIFIAKEIRDFVQNGFGTWEDFGIFITDIGRKHTLIDVFNALNIPTNYNKLSENFVQFRIKLEQFLNICEIFYSLKVETINDEALNFIFENSLKNDEINLILENLRPKNADLAAIYEFYKNADYMKIISYVAEIEKIDETEINNKVWSLMNFCKNIIKERPQNSFLLDIIDNVLYNSKNNAKNCVTIFSNKNSLNGKVFKSLYLPALIETAFVNKEYIYFVSQKTNNIISEEIKKIAPDFCGLIPAFGTNLDIKKFSDALKLSSFAISLSTFGYFETKQISPSVLFDLFKNVDLKNFKKIEENEVETEFCEEVCIEEDRYESEKIIGENEVLKLNPSAISNFQNCPKKYFYKNLLKLKEQNDFLASYGSIAHAILEVFNKTCKGEKYNKNEMLKLCDTLFLAKTSFENAENALEVGFKEIDVELVKSSDDLSLMQMRDNFYDAVSGLLEAGFFNNPPDETYCEEKFEFELPEIKNVVFDGRIDCIRKEKTDYCNDADEAKNNGGCTESFSVVDYKTGKDKKKPLKYYASEFGVNFQSDYRQYTGKFSEKLVDEYQYQIPIYYLGIENAKQLLKFKDKTAKFMLEYIRPKSLDGGYKQDVVEKSELKAVEEKIIQNLKERVVEVIRAQSEFLPEPELHKCLNCSYSFLCEGIDNFHFEDAIDE